MTADFALSLLLEGIRLHRRTPEGWELVGKVPLDSPDLPRDLHALREAGEATGTLWQGTRLLLPPQQVRTLTLDGARHEDEVLAALHEVTPYAVEDLVLDFGVFEGRTHVAAVARETLEEAEAFAAEHGFRPMAFAAVLPGFPREAEFGPTRLAATLAAPEEPVEAVTDVPDEAPASDMAETVARDAPALAGSGPDPVEVVPVALPDEPPAPTADPEAILAEVAFKPAPDATTAADEAPAASLSAPTMPEPILASSPRPLQGERRLPGAPEATRGPEGQRVEPSLGTAKPPANPAWALAAAPAAARPDPRLPPRPAAARPEPAVAPAANAPDPLRAAPQGRAPRPADVEPPAVAGWRDKARVGGKPRFMGLVLTVLLLIAMAAMAVLAASSEQGLAGLFQRAAPAATGIAAAPPAEGTPVSPGVAEAEAPPAPTEPSVSVASAAPEAPAAPSPEASEIAAQAVAAAMAALPRVTEAPEAAEPAPADEVAVVEGPADATEPPADAAVSAEEADRIYAATGVWLRAPGLPLLSEPGEAAASLTVPALSPGKALPPPPVLAALAPDAGPQGEVAPAVPGGLEPDDGPSAATSEALTTASGVQVAAGSPPRVPPTRSGTPVPEATDWVNAMAEPPSRVPPARPDAPEGLRGTAAAEVQGPPAPASDGAAPWANAMAEPPARFPPDRPETPAEVLAAQAVSLPAGPMALAFAADAAGATAGGVSLAGLRPAPRPDDLSPPEGYEPPPTILASFDGPRPGPRPDDIAPEAPAAEAPVAEAPEAPEAASALAEALDPSEAPAAAPPAAPDLQSTLAAIVQGAPDPLAGATRQAVAVARVPDPRPRNFDRVVQRQLDRVARASQAAAPRSQGGAARSGAGGVGTGGLTAQEEAEVAGEAEVASSAAAVPSGQTATSVAAAATRTDVIALRDMNLIGVYGQPNARRALVRLGNGRYLRVGVGDQLDGGQVTAIGDYALNYTKRGRTHQLVIPGG